MQWLKKRWFWIALALAVGFLALHTMSPPASRKADGAGDPESLNGLPI
jgi:hypothetical protein